MSGCGTSAGAQAHYKRGESACSPCRAAAAAHQRECVARLAHLPCSVAGCARPLVNKARALCNKHYHDLKQCGPLPPLPRRSELPKHPRPTPEERFWLRVQKSDGCWLWAGQKNWQGYGMWKRNGRFSGAHRTAYELAVGPIPDGLHLDHLCRVRDCVNPAHLEPVTPQENNRRSESVSARNSRKTHCKNGHEFTAENTYIRQHDGGRFCRACHTARQRRYKEAARAQA